MEFGLKDLLCFQLYVASRLIVQGYGEELSELGLTYPQYLVLLALKEKNGQTVSELGALLNLDSGTLSPLLKGLLTKGEIERQRLPQDERTVVNYLTAKGLKKCKEASKVVYQLFKETGLSTKDFEKRREDLKDFVLRCKRIIEKNKGEAPIKKPRGTQRIKKESPWKELSH